MFPSSFFSANRHVACQGRIDGAKAVLANSNDPSGLIRAIIGSSDAVATFFIELGNHKIVKGQTLSMKQVKFYDNLMRVKSNLPVITAEPRVRPLRQTDFQAASEYAKRAKSPSALGDFIRASLGLQTIESFEDTVSLMATGITGTIDA